MSEDVYVVCSDCICCCALRVAVEYWEEKRETDDSRKISWGRLIIYKSKVFDLELR